MFKLCVIIKYNIIYLLHPYVGQAFPLRFLHKQDSTIFFQIIFYTQSTFVHFSY